MLAHKVVLGAKVGQCAQGLQALLSVLRGAAFQNVLQAMRVNVRATDAYSLGDLASAKASVARLATKGL